MKRIFVSAIYFLTTLITLAQGTVHFSNRVPAVGLNVLVTDSDGVTLLGSSHVAQLYAGGPATAESSLEPVGLPVPFKVNQTRQAPLGWFDGGTVTIPNILPGGAAVVQVRYWEAVGGATYEAASASGKRFGKSYALFLAATGNPLSEPPGLPVYLMDLCFVPEPSPLALGAFGAAILWLWRWRSTVRG